MLSPIAPVYRSALTSIFLVLAVLFHLLAPLNPASHPWDRGPSRCEEISPAKAAPGLHQQATSSWLHAAYPQEDFPGELQSSRITDGFGPLGNPKQIFIRQGLASVIQSFPVTSLRFFLSCIVPPTPDSQVHLERAPPKASF